jgi:hypothetical protein
MEKLLVEYEHLENPFLSLMHKNETRAQFSSQDTTWKFRGYWAA